MGHQWQVFAAVILAQQIILLQCDTGRTMKLRATCSRSGMRVTVDFNDPFWGTIFAMGYYSETRCRFVPNGAGRKRFAFYVPSQFCGTKNQGQSALQTRLVVQQDPDLQQEQDIVHLISCSWSGTFLRKVSAPPIHFRDR